MVYLVVNNFFIPCNFFTCDNYYFEGGGVVCEY
jgi:hypothetical protein